MIYPRPTADANWNQHCKTVLRFTPQTSLYSTHILWSFTLLVKKTHIQKKSIAAFALCTHKLLSNMKRLLRVFNVCSCDARGTDESWWEVKRQTMCGGGCCWISAALWHTRSSEWIRSRGNGYTLCRICSLFYLSVYFRCWLNLVTDRCCVQLALESKQAQRRPSSANVKGEKKKSENENSPSCLAQLLTD